MTATEEPSPMLDTEDALQRHLDLHPDDHQARLVLADLLEERSDPRAAGYRRLGELRRVPATNAESEAVDPGKWGWTYFDNPTWEGKHNTLHSLHYSWFRAIYGDVPSDFKKTDSDSRRDIENLTALAYRPEFEESPPEEFR